MKRHLMLNVDDELVEAAKKKGFVLSEIMDEALRQKAKPMRKDFAESSLKIICHVCSKGIEKGYRCDDRCIAICDDCHENYPIHKCIHDISGEHVHTRFGDPLEPLVSKF